MSIIDSKRIEVFDQEDLSYEVRLYIQDSGVPDGSRDPEYVDFSNRLTFQGRDLLKKIGTISMSSEGKAGVSSFVGSVNNIELDNKDGFWNRPIPRAVGTVYPSAGSEKVYRTYPTKFKTVNNNTAYFDLTYNYTQNVWHKHKVKLVLFTTTSEGQTLEDTLIVNIINEIKRSSNKDFVTMSLWDLSMPLRKLDVSNVRDGLSWWENKPISLLVEKILKKEYKTIPDSFIIPKLIEIPTARRVSNEASTDPSNDARVLSSFGRPPEYDLDSDTWKSLGLYTRAMCLWQWTASGPINTTEVSRITFDNTGTSKVAGYTGYNLSNQLTPKVGDAVRINHDQKNDTKYKNDGIYIIRNIDASYFYFETAMKGNAVPSGGLEFVISRIYMGCDSELWEYLPDRDVYRKIKDISELTTPASESEYIFKIRRLWFNPGTNTILGVAWPDPCDYGFTTTVGGVNNTLVTNSRKSVKAVFFKYDGTNVTQLTSKLIIPGDFTYRDGRIEESGSDHNITVGGASGGNESICLPFKQSIVPCNVMGPDGNIDYSVISTIATEANCVGSGLLTQSTWTYDHEPNGFPLLQIYGGTNHSIASGTVSQAMVEMWNFTVYPHEERRVNRDLLADYYSVSEDLTSDEAGFAIGGAWLRYSQGQEGFCVYNSTGNTEGAIWYFSMVDELDIKLYCYDVAAGSHIHVSGAITNSSTASFSLFNSVSRLGYNTGVVPWTTDNTRVLPMCGCVPPDGGEGVVIGLQVWCEDAAVGSMTSPKPTSVTYIIRMSTDSADNRKVIYQSDKTSTDSDSFFTPLSIAPEIGSDNVWVSGLKRDSLSDVDAYCIVGFDVSSTYTDLPTKVDRYKQPTKLTSNHDYRYASLDDSNCITDHIYFVEAGTGTLYSLSVPGQAVTINDYGAPIVEGDMYQESNIVIDKITRSRKVNESPYDHYNDLVWGVSGVAPLRESMLSPPNAKSYLWKFDCYLSSRVELANFENMNAWDALSDLAQISDHIIGFNQDDFYFVPRVYNGSPDFEFKNDGQYNRVKSVSLQENRSEVYNYVEIVPYVVSFAQPTWKAEWITRGINDVNPNVDISILQNDVKRKTIKMICVEGGFIVGSSTDYEGGINIGDKNGTTWKYLVYDRIIDTSLSSAITAPATATTLNVYEGASDIESGDRIEVYTVISSLEYVAVYTVNSSSTDSEELTGTINVTYSSILSSANQPSGGYPVNSTVKITKSQDWTTSDSDYVTIRGRYFTPIGSTNVSIKIQDDNSGVYNPDDLASSETVFYPGDSIIIECKGLVSSKNEAARQIQFDHLSIYQYEKNPYPNIDNRFTNYKIARELAKKIVKEFAWPKFLIEINSPLYPFIKFLYLGDMMSLFTVKDPYLFPLSKEYTRTGSLRSVSHNPFQGSTKVIIRDIDFY